ncbi:OHCU decarboxylase [Hasllibacter halocynthiae]|uniref:Chitooligosaccharide deacetylase n=1 Tax=Hasllibacter halocynthiae TaxID=595589 RepID=A0A2T0X9Z4_9RHOB|nr:2-oxo-4-hydroxy-4-carboxy-5-ureidoimidazoline decarboxylase [Hasllibacter halocynthiae]PRY95771.1 OHCU decarboxylase [Hasllibacter halocynthiae]
MPPRYPRDTLGYGPMPPDARWPDGARVALSLVLNYEEGAENSPLHGDAASEAFLSEITGAVPWEGQRHWNMESLYEYGARAGFWRLHRMLGELPVTVFGVANALLRSPTQVEAMRSADWEIACHGDRWVEHAFMSEEEEREEIRSAVRNHVAATGTRPEGWYTGRCSLNTVRLVHEEVGPLYTSDVYDDDLPHRVRIGDASQLALPYTLDCNDMRFAISAGHPDPSSWERHLTDTFDMLHEEGGRMMTVGLHCRLAGRPGRAIALRRFLDHVREKGGAWIATRADIARHWNEAHPPQEPQRTTPLSDRPVEIGAGATAPELSEEAFVDRFGDVFEHSAWVAAQAWRRELGPAHHSPAGMHAVMAEAFRNAPDADRLAVLNAHPDLAGKLASAGRLTADSTAEQASAGLDLLTDAEREAFQTLNAAYVEKHGFPFIIAVRDHDKPSIMSAMDRRLANDTGVERREAEAQVLRIARLRLEAMDW